MSAPSNFVQVWKDDFSDLTLGDRWKPTTNLIAHGYGQEIWDAGHVTLGGNQLILSATPDMLSGEVRGLQSFSLPLYVEFRAKLPACGPGAWPGGWTLDWGNLRQEVDVFECNSSKPHVIGENLHWINGGVKNGSFTDAAVDFTADYHVYGAYIAVDRIEFYVDDKLTPNTWFQPVPPVIMDPLQLRLSLSIFGAGQATWAAPPDASTIWPMQFLIDWVHVWQPGVTPVPVPVPDTTSPTVAIRQPLSGSPVLRRSTVAVQAVASDNVGITKVEFYVNNVKLYASTISSVLQTTFYYSFTTSGKRGAPYEVELVVYDAAGNMASASETVYAK